MKQLFFLLLFLPTLLWAQTHGYTNNGQLNKWNPHDTLKANDMNKNFNAIDSAINAMRNGWKDTLTGVKNARFTGGTQMDFSQSGGFTVHNPSLTSSPKLTFALGNRSDSGQVWFDSGSVRMTVPLTFTTNFSSITGTKPSIGFSGDTLVIKDSKGMHKLLLDYVSIGQMLASSGTSRTQIGNNLNLQTFTASAGSSPKLVFSDGAGDSAWAELGGNDGKAVSISRGGIYFQGTTASGVGANTINFSTNGDTLFLGTEKIVFANATTNQALSYVGNHVWKPATVSGGGGGTSEWNALLSPTDNLFLNMLNTQTQFSWSGFANGSEFELLDNNGSDSTGIMLSLKTGASSAIKPFKFVNNSGNGIEITRQAFLNPVGSGKIRATSVSSLVASDSITLGNGLPIYLYGTTTGINVIKNLSDNIDFVMDITGSNSTSLSVRASGLFAQGMSPISGTSLSFGGHLYPSSDGSYDLGTSTVPAKRWRNVNISGSYTGTWAGSTIGVSVGGTGSTSFTAGKPVYYNGLSLVSAPNDTGKFRWSVTGSAKAADSIRFIAASANISIAQSGNTVTFDVPASGGKMLPYEVVDSLNRTSLMYFTKMGQFNAGANFPDTTKLFNNRIGKVATTNDYGVTVGDSSSSGLNGVTTGFKSTNTGARTNVLGARNTVSAKDAIIIGQGLTVTNDTSVSIFAASTAKHQAMIMTANDTLVAGNLRHQQNNVYMNEGGVFYLRGDTNRTTITGLTANGIVFAQTQDSRATTWLNVVPNAGYFRANAVVAGQADSLKCVYWIMKR